MDSEARAGIIDCDIHLVVPTVEVLFPYLTEHWRETIRQTAFKGATDTSYPRGTTIDPQPNTPVPGSDLAQLRVQVLDPDGTEYGILTCSYAIESIRNPFAAAALAAAVNEWQAREWLDREPRLRGSIVVPSQDPELAAREIDRVGAHPAFVQVHLPVRAEAPYGNRRYYPIYAAALRHDLAIGIHVGGQPGHPPTAAGWPSHFAEEDAGMGHVFQSQVIALVTEGVFDHFPTLRVALIESGVSWLPSLMWRLDKEWKGLRREVPWVRRPPSEYIRDRVRLTTRPFDAPADPAHVREIIDQLGSEELLMFATGFPHADGGQRDDPLLRSLPEALARKIKRENARAFYGLP